MNDNSARLPSRTGKGAVVEDRCKVPDFAIAMGHEEKWKLRNNCK